METETVAASKTPDINFVTADIPSSESFKRIAQLRIKESLVTDAWANGYTFHRPVEVSVRYIEVDPLEFTHISAYDMKAMIIDTDTPKAGDYLVISKPNPEPDLDACLLAKVTHVQSNKIVSFEDAYLIFAH